MKSILLLILTSSLPTSPTRTNAAYISLTNSIPKCVVIETGSPIEFEVDYESPDIRIIDEEYEKRKNRIVEEKAKRDGLHLENMKQKVSRSASGSASSGSQSRSKEEEFISALDNLVNMQDAMGTTQMTITEFDKNAKPIRRTTKDNNKNKSTTKKKVETTVLKQRQGKVRFQMVQYDTARVCVQTYGASASKPTFVHLQIREFFNIPKHEQYEQPQIYDEKSQEEKREQKLIDTHMKYLEREIGLLIHASNRMINATPRLKHSHSLLHIDLVKLHTTVKWINIFQTCIFLITAFSCVTLLKIHFKKLKFIF